MTDRTRQTLIVLGAGVGALLILGFSSAFLYLLIVGRASVPESIVSAITLGIVGLITTGAIFINGQLSRQRSDANAQQTQATVVKAAEATQAHVAEVVQTLATAPVVVVDGGKP